MCAPLCDSKGKVRYFIGAQIDISGLIMDDVRMDSMKELSTPGQSLPNGHPDTEGEPPHQNGHTNGHTHNDSVNADLPNSPDRPKKAGEARNNLMEFAELLSPGELSMLQEHGGSLFEPVVPRRDRPYMGHMKPRIMLRQGRPQSRDKINPISKQPNLPGVYDNVRHPFSPYYTARALTDLNSTCWFDLFLPFGSSSHRLLSEFPVFYSLLSFQN
jgi:hypothetical protein